jgi:hypothetical protein
MENARPNLQKVNQHHNTWKKKSYIKIGHLKRSCRAGAFWRLKEVLEVSTLSFHTGHCTSKQRMLTRYVVRIISDPFCIHCGKCWTSLLALAQQKISDVHRDKNITDLNQGEEAGHAAGPPRPLHCYRNTLFKNSRSARRKCGRAPSCMNRKWMRVCRSISCNSSGRTFRRQLW